jgi:hypothetical protein
MADPRTKKILYSPGSGNPDGVDGPFPSVPYELLSDDYSESYVDGQPSVTMRVRTRWPGSYKFVANMLGVACTDSTSTSGLTRYIPAEFPDTDYQATIFTSGFNNTAFLGWWCTSAKLVGTHGELTCQDQVTGALVPSLKNPMDLISGTDYDATTGELYDSGYSSDKPVQTGVGFAEYELTYEPLPFEILTDAEQGSLDSPLSTNELCRYVIRRYRFGGNAFTLQPGSLYWRDRLIANANDPAARIDSSPTKVFGSGNFTYTWLNVPTIDWTAITNCIGKVNRPNTNNGDDIASAEYPAGTGTALPGAPLGKWDYRPTWQGISVPGGVIDGFLPRTLLFEGVSDIVPKVTATGQLVHDITYNFFFRKDGHQRIYRADDNTFQRVVTVASKKAGVPANYADYIDTADFNTLFQLS